MQNKNSPIGYVIYGTEWRSKCSLLGHIIRGCGYVPHCGNHPGTTIVLALLLISTIGGLDCVAVSSLMFLPLYFWGAYDRSVMSERLCLKNDE